MSDDLRDKLEELRGQFSEYHRWVDLNRRMYARDFEAEVNPTDDPDLFIFIPPTARRAIDEPADHILSFPNVNVPVRETGDDYLKNEAIATKKRQFSHSLWRNVEAGPNVIADARKPMLIDGRACIRWQLKWDLIPDVPNADDFKTTTEYRRAKRTYKKAMENMGKYEFLWEPELLDTKTVFEDPTDHRNPAYVFVEYDILREAAKRDFPSASGDWTKGSDYDTVKYIEYWSRPKHKFDGTWTPGKLCRWIEDEKVDEGDNPYPYIPIAIDDSGRGVNYKGAKIHDKYVGYAQHLWSTYVAEARQYTSWESVTEVSAFAPVITRNMDPTKNIVVGPKSINRLNGGKDEPTAESIEFLDRPGLPIEVIQLAQRTQQIADQSVKMDTLSGVPVKGVETATEADQQIRNAASILQGMVGGLQRLAAKLTSWALMDVDVVIAAPVTIYGTGTADSPGESVTLSPKEIDGFYRVTAELTTVDEDALSLNEARFWMDAYQRSPFMPAAHALVKGKITDDPLAFITQRLAEDELLSPEMRQIRAITTANAFGELKQMLDMLIEQGGVNTPGPGTPTAGEPSNTEVPAQRSLNTFDKALEQRSVNQGAAELYA